ncbi:MAG: M23 family metallopeptidase [Acidobacteria bacterium]|nr:M23 family metallopeptidase [Acidobacteriota bacterium]
MKKHYFIVVLAHSVHGRLRRVHVPQRVIYVVLGLALLGCISLFGFVSSYARMAWKVADYNSLRSQFNTLMASYENLQKVAHQTDEQLATLQLFASQVSLAYGIKQKLEGPDGISAEGRLVPTFQESLEEYNFLRSASYSRSFRNYPHVWQVNSRPSLWPVDGRLRGFFGRRTDPFSGEGAFHRGVDILAPVGTPVRATADGVVRHAEFMSSFGRIVIIDHGGGLQTYYAHMSRFAVVAGQEIRRGELLGYVGISGRATAPHLHYEVRQHGNAVNPYSFLAKSPVASQVRRDFNF